MFCRARIVGLLVFVMLSGPALFAQAKKAPEVRSKITVRVVDGVTGLPEWFEFPNIWIGGSTSPGNPRLNFRGEVQMDITEAAPRILRFLPNWYADCRFSGDADKGMELRYSLDDILETGVVGANVCGGVHTKPQPGVIIFYVRSRTLPELIAL